MEPQLSDYGLVRLLNPGVSSHTTKTIVGTLGYTAPE